jgi:hypothetical protein
MEALRRAAEQLLVELGEEPELLGSVQIERLSCDVQIGRQQELVSLRLRDGRLYGSCSCAALGCAHVRQALRLLVGTPQNDGTRRSTSRLERVVAETPAAVSGKELALESNRVLSEALEDVVTAVVRAGVASERAASVLETLSRVEVAAGNPLPFGVRRWLGRMREALDAREVNSVAHALNAAATLAADVRAPQPDAKARKRTVAWLGASSAEGIEGVERITDRVLIEVAREWLTGTERAQIERRYLVDLQSGEAFREEGVRRERPASLGGCPRSIEVGLAEVELGGAPRRLRLLQYTTTPRIDRASWDLLAAFGQRDSDAVLMAYRSAQRELGALAEPFALVVPRAVQHTPQLALRLDRGPALPLADEDAGVLRRFEILLGSGGLCWVAGRLLDRAGQLLLKPLAVGVVDDDHIRHERL